MAEKKQREKTQRKRYGEEGWTSIKAVIDIVHEPIIILDKHLRVMAANEPFYRTFQVLPKNTEGSTIYELGNGQWDIPALRKLLEDILPKNTFFKGFEVNHMFPTIGRKVMMLNAQEIHYKEGTSPETYPPIILLVIEDVTEMMNVAEMLAKHTMAFEGSIVDRTEKLEALIKGLEKEIKDLKNNS